MRGLWLIQFTALNVYGTPPYTKNKITEKQKNWRREFSFMSFINYFDILQHILKKKSGVLSSLDMDQQLGTAYSDRVRSLRVKVLEFKY